MKRHVLAATLIFFLNICLSISTYAADKSAVSPASQAAKSTAVEYLGSAFKNVENPQPIKGPDILSTAFRLLFSLLLVIALIYIVIIGLKYFYVHTSVPFTQSGVVRILAKEYLDAKNILYIIEFGGKVVLLGVSGEGISSISEITDDLKVKEIREQADEFTAKYRLKKETDFSEVLKNSYLKEGQKIVSSGNKVIKNLVDRIKKGGKQ